MQKLKNEQREKKKQTREGQMTYLQNKSDSSLSSSDEEALDGEREEDGGAGAGRAGLGRGQSGKGAKGSLRRRWQSVKEPKKGFMNYIAGGDQEKNVDKKKEKGPSRDESQHPVDGSVIEEKADANANASASAGDVKRATKTTAS